MPASEYWEELPDDFSEESHWLTDVSEFDSGKTQRRARWNSDRKVYHFGYPNFIDDQITDLFEFWTDRRGNYESFYLAVPPSCTHSETVVGAVTVTLSEATKPSPSNIVVYLDGMLVEGWTFSEAMKQISFTNALTGSLVVTYYELKLVRFQSNIYSRDWLLYLVTNQTIDFVEVK